MKRVEPNILLAVVTVLALALVVISACLYAAPELALKYVAVALGCSVGFVFLNRAFMKARKRQPRTLISRDQPGVMIFAAIFPMVVLSSALLPLIAPNADYGLMIIIAAVFTGVTVESALEARRLGRNPEA